jgi:hypothetical protein
MPRVSGKLDFLNSAAEKIYELLFTSILEKHYGQFVSIRIM